MLTLVTNIWQSMRTSLIVGGGRAWATTTIPMIWLGTERLCVRAILIRRRPVMWITWTEKKKTDRAREVRCGSLLVLSCISLLTGFWTCGWRILAPNEFFWVYAVADVQRFCMFLTETLVHSFVLFLLDNWYRFVHLYLLYIYTLLFCVFFLFNVTCSHRESSPLLSLQ